MREAAEQIIGGSSAHKNFSTVSANIKGGDIIEGNHNVPYEMMPKNKSYIGSGGNS